MLRHPSELKSKSTAAYVTVVSAAPRPPPRRAPPRPPQVERVSARAPAPQVSPQVKVYMYPELPEAGSSPEAGASEPAPAAAEGGTDGAAGAAWEAETVLLFPCEGAVVASDVDWAGVRRVLAIDSTWITSNQILRDPRLSR